MQRLLTSVSGMTAEQGRKTTWQPMQQNELKQDIKKSGGCQEMSGNVRNLNDS